LTRGEKILRDQLLLFYLYLFGDFGDFVLWPALEQTCLKLVQDSTSPASCPPGGAKSGTTVASSAAQNTYSSASNVADQRHNRGDNSSLFADGDARACFDVSSYLNWKAGKTISLPVQLQALLKEFIHTQAFAQFCTDRALILFHQKKTTSDRNVVAAASSAFDRALFHMRPSSAAPGPGGARLIVSISTAKQAIAAASSSGSNGSTEDGGAGDSSGLGRMLAHWPTFTFTDDEATEASSASNASTSNSVAAAIAAEVAALEQLCVNAQDTNILPLMLNTLFQRVHNCWLASANGVQGRKGHRALKVLHFLLHFLPTASVAEVLGRTTGHLLPALWAILGAKATQHSYLDSSIGELLFHADMHSALEGFMCLHRDRLADRAAAPQADSSSSPNTNTPAFSPAGKGEGSSADSFSFSSQRSARDGRLGAAVTSGPTGSGGPPPHPVVLRRITVSATGTSDRCKMQCIALLLLLLDPYLLEKRRKIAQGMQPQTRTAANATDRSKFVAFVSNTILNFACADGLVDGSYGAASSGSGNSFLATGKCEPHVRSCMCRCRCKFIHRLLQCERSSPLMLPLQLMEL